MAFWGIEVKPGKPFTHAPDDARGRLHISQATLGIGAATKKSLLQCNIGNRSPVFLCSLFPEKAECCQLNLEFEEADEVVFSVIGPRSVHLTGYFLGGGRHYSLHNDASESYGEDIADTETERSSHHSEEDKYDDSFIDDGDPQVCTPSVSSGEVNEKIFNKSKSKHEKAGRRRLRKKYQLSESEDDNSSRQQDLLHGCTGVQVLDGGNEDKLPISSLYKSNPTTKDAKFEAQKKADEDKVGTGYNKTKNDDNYITISEKEADAVVESQPESQPSHQGSFMARSAEVIPETSPKPNKKRKRKTKEEMFLVAGDANCCNSLLEVKAQQNVVEPDKMGQYLPAKDEEQKAASYENCDNARNHYADENQYMEQKKKKKQKQRSKSEESGEAMDMENLLSLTNEKSTSVTGVKDRKADDMPYQSRTLSNGLIIEELEMGKPDGKIAASGKKVSVHYIGKLKQNGEVFDSNVDKAPLKLRLGGKDIIEGWNVGLDGMRVGGKRRLIIPPSMGYGNEGAGEKVPPNSWLVYDVELIRVR